MKKILVILMVIGLAKTALGAGNTLPTLAYGESIEFGLDFSFRSLNLSNEQSETSLNSFYEAFHFASKIYDFQYQIYAGLTQYTTTSFGFFAGLNPRYDITETFFDSANQYIIFFASFNILFSYDVQAADDLTLLELKGELGASYGVKSLGLTIYSTLNAGAMIYGRLSGEAVDFTESPFFGLKIGAKKVFQIGLNRFALRLEASFFREYMLSASIALVFKQTYDIIVN